MLLMTPLARSALALLILWWAEPTIGLVDPVVGRADNRWAYHTKAHDASPVDLASRNEGVNLKEPGSAAWTAGTCCK